MAESESKTAKAGGEAAKQEQKAQATQATQATQAQATQARATQAQAEQEQKQKQKLGPVKMPKGPGTGGNAPKGRNPNLVTGWPDDPEKCRRMAEKQRETKRRQKTFRESVKALLRCKVIDPEMRKQLNDLGLDDTMLNQIQLAVWGKAANGDVEAARFLRDTAGEKPRDALEVGGLDGRPLAAIDMTGMTDDELRALAAQRSEQSDEDGGRDEQSGVDQSEGE